MNYKTCKVCKIKQDEKNFFNDYHNKNKLTEMCLNCRIIRRQTRKKYLNKYKRKTDNKKHEKIKRNPETPQTHTEIKININDSLKNATKTEDINRLIFNLNVIQKLNPRYIWSDYGKTWKIKQKVLLDTAENINDVYNCLNILNTEIIYIE